MLNDLGAVCCTARYKTFERSVIEYMNMALSVRGLGDYLHDANQLTSLDSYLPTDYFYFNDMICINFSMY